MAETVHARILRYLDEAHAAEHHLEKVFQGFAEAASANEADAFLQLANRARSHQAALERAVTGRGSSISKFRTGFAETLAFAPIHARMGKIASEQASQNVIFAAAATSFQMGTYAALASAASVIREDEVAKFAQQFLAEEQSYLKSISQLTSKIPINEAHPTLVIAYLEDAVAAEHSFESQIKSFVKRAEQQPEAQPACTLFTEHAKATREDFEHLTRRLQSLGAEPSALKGFFAEVFNAAPKFAGTGHDPNEQLTQDLITLFAIANAQVAICRELQNVAHATEDDTTEALAIAIAQNNQAAADKAWAEIEPAAQVSIGTMPYATSS
jgi:ferritin-like metal-binding protein YciE